MRSSGHRWKTSCCGIFCTAQKGSECKGKIPCYISSQDRVFHGSYVQVLCHIQKRLLCLRPSLHKYKDLLNREFHADGPNSKWVTDISYIHTKQGVLYPSMIRDLYDNSIVAYKTGTQQTVDLVLDTIRLSMKKERRSI